MSFRKAFLLATTLVMTLGASSALAEGGGSSGGMELAKFGAALGIGIAAFGGALGQGKTASSALEGIARNPAASGKVFMPMIIGLALIESLVLYSFVISILVK